MSYSFVDSITNPGGSSEATARRAEAIRDRIEDQDRARMGGYNFVDNISEIQQPQALLRASAIPNDVEQPQEVKTRNPFKQVIPRSQEVVGNLAEGYTRVAKPFGVIDQTISKASPFLGSLNLLRRTMQGQEGLEQEKRGLDELQAWAQTQKDVTKDVGYAPTKQLGDLATNPLNVVPFVAERVITSLPDMAAAVVAPKAYIAARTNELLNERLKNDNKTLEQATFADVAAAATGAVIETTLERFATKSLLKGGVGQGSSVGGRIGRATALQSGTEGLEEGAANLAATLGTERGVDLKELGAQMLEGAIVGGGLGATVQSGKEAYVKATPQKDADRRFAALASAIDQDVNQTTFAQSGMDAQARMALDPSLTQEQRREVSNVRLQDLADIAAAEREADASGTTTAVINSQTGNEPDKNVVGSSPGEPINNLSTSPAAVNLSTTGDAATDVVAQSEQKFLDDLDLASQQQKQAVEQPETLAVALNGIAADLQLQPNETLNVTEVTTDKRLNKFAEALSQAFGVNVHWVDFGEQGMTTSTGRNLGGFNGYRLDNTILVSPNADFMDTTWHELTHTLETKYPEIYARLRDIIVSTADPVVKQRLYDALNTRRMQEVGQPMSAAQLESELVAVVVGQQSTDPALLGQLFDSFQDKTLAQQFRDVLTEILDRLSAALRGPQYIKDRQRVNQARDAIKTAFAEYQKREAARVGGTAQTAVATGQQTIAVATQPATQTVAQPAAPITQTAAPPVKPEKQGKFSREELLGALVNGDAISVTDLIAHPDIFAVYQQTRAVLRRAPPVKKVFDDRAKVLADREGMTLKSGPIKSFDRSFSKIWFDYSGDHTKIGDVVRSTLVVNDLRDLQDMIKATTSFFDGVSIKRNGWDPNAPVHPSGYRDVFFRGASFLNFSVELQMNFAPMMEAKEIAHGFYKIEDQLRRDILSQDKPMSPGDISAAQDQIRELQLKQFQLYSVAAQRVFDGANAPRQAASVIGTPSDVQVDKPNERGATSPVPGLSSQADNVPSGARVTGTPITSKKVVPSGNEAGISISLPPVTIPNSNIPQQVDTVQEQTDAPKKGVSQYSRSTVLLMQMSDADARRAIGMDAKSNKVRDVGAALNAKTLKEDGEISDKNTTEEAMKEIADILVGEISYQLGTSADTGTGLGWYSANYPNAVKRLARVYPELDEDAGARNVFTAIVAITSNGEKVSTNISNALKIYDGFRDGGALQPVGTRRGSMSATLDRLQALIDQFGMDGFSDHLLEELTVGQINASLRAAGKKANSSYTADTVMPRAALYFGPKLGAFYANLMGSEGYLTMDLWWSRTFNRIRGTLIPEPTKSSVESVRQLLGLPENVDDEVVALSAIPYQESYKQKKYKGGTELEKKANTLVKTTFLELNEAPFRASDRSFMIGTTLMAQEKLSDNGVKLTLADIQAALWYYEKRLYAKLTGRKTDDIGYEEAIIAAAEGDRPQRSPARFNRGGTGGTVGTTVGRDVATDVPVNQPEARTEPTEVETVGQYSRPLVLDAINGKATAPDLFIINENPRVLTAVGAPEEPLVISKRTVMKVSNPEGAGKFTEDFRGYNSAGFQVQRAKRIALTVDELRSVPRMIGNPVAIIKVMPNAQLNRRESYKVVLDMVKEGNPVIAIVQPGVPQRSKETGVTMRASEIASIYPVNQESSLRETNSEIAAQQLLYFNKGKATVLASKIGSKLSALTSGATGLRSKKPGDFRSLEYDLHPKSNFSRSMAEDIALQEEFLIERAKESGFENVDAWIDADYNGFVKSAAEWRSQNPVNEGFFSRRVALQGNKFTLPARTVREKYLENLFQNRMSRVEDIQQAVQQQGGTLDIKDSAGNVLGSTDITAASQRMRGAVRGRLDRFKKEVEIPLIEDAAKAGVDLDEAAQYLYAMYAPERNLIIQTRNPSQFPTDGGSGMTNAEAAKIVADFRKRADFPVFQAIAKRFQDITNMTQSILVNEGLVDAATVNQWKAENPNYVPLRGFESVDEETGSSLGVGSPGRLDPRNPFVRIAKGRESRAGNIVENILKDYTDAVVVAEKNKVYRLLGQFVRDNPDRNLWEINAPSIKRSYIRNQLQSPLGFISGEVRIAFETNQNPNETIAYRVKGRPVFIKVADPGMLDDLKMTGAIGSGDQAKLYFRVWAGAMSTLAKVRTTLSPAFVAIDAVRNAETGGFYNLVKYGPSQAIKAYGRLYQAARVAWKAERDNNWTGSANQTVTINPPGQPSQTLTLKQLYDMYRADGGKVGYLDIKEIEDIQKDIQTRFKAAQVAGSLNPKTYLTQSLNALSKVEDLMLDAAGSIESAMRFATYMTRLEAGANRMDATNAAKNVTVNFDAKGKWTPYLGLGYMFANANIQGAKQTTSIVFKSGKAGAAVGGGLIALGYGLAQLGALSLGDDDQPYWDKEVYRQSKFKSLVFFDAIGNSTTVPMAYGLGFFVNMGYALSDLQRGVPLAKVGAFLRDSFFTHFSPFGSMENLATFFSPTLLDPIAVVAMNKTEQGLPLMPDSAYDKGKPDSEKFWTSTRGTMFQQLSQYLNEATGGTQGMSGAVDVSPETMRYWVGWFTGGVGGAIRDAAESIYLTSEIGADAAFEKNKVPILKAFYQSNTGKADQIEFYRNAEKAERAINEWKLLYGTEQAKKPEVADRLREERKLQALGAAVDDYKKALSGLRRQEVDVIDKRTSGRYDAAEAEAKLKNIAEDKARLYKRFNKAFYKADPNTPGN